MKQFFNFDHLITPKMIHLLYLIINLFMLIAAVILIMTQKAGIFSLIGLLIAFVIVRVLFEMVMITFKNNEYLRDIAQGIKQLNQLPPRNNDTIPPSTPT